MEAKKETLKKIKILTKKYFSFREKKKFVYGKTVIPLSIPTYDWKEAYDSIESIMTTWVTMGKKVKNFEKKYAKIFNVLDATMVNSGSSANLLALSALSNPLNPNRIMPGDEIITPAVTFATAVYPILNISAVPVLVDVDMKTLNLDLSEVEKAITKKTKAIMPVHLLGNPCDIEGIMRIAKKHNLYVIEDAADSSGAEVKGKKVGTFGDMGTYSFFFTHIMSTIEGGMVVTNNEKFSELLKSMRSFGWIRDLKNKKEIAKSYPNIDPRFLFINIGYNFKVTDIQGAFGINQLNKLPGFIKTRRKNANYWSQKLEKYEEFFWIIREQPNTKSAWYGYPIIVKPNSKFNKNDLENFLRKRGVQTRPILSGNIDEQPSMKLFNYKKVGNLPISKIIQRNSFWLGNHHGISETEKKAVFSYIEEFFEKKNK